MERFLEMLQLVHHLVVDLQSARRIEDHQPITLVERLSDTGPRDLHDVVGGTISVDRDIEIATERLQLIYGCGAIDVGGNESSRASFGLEFSRQFAGGCRFSGPLESDHHYHGGGHGPELESLAPFAQHRGKLFMNDL